MHGIDTPLHHTYEMAFKLDLPAYLARVGLGRAAVAPPSRAALAKLMLAQSRSIAFENCPDRPRGRFHACHAPLSVFHRKSSL